MVNSPKYCHWEIGSYLHPIEKLTDLVFISGLKYGTRACCGYGGGTYNFNQDVYCGNSKVVNGKAATAGACGDPQNYVSWDGIHATEAANKKIAYAVISGTYSYPPFDLSKLCSP